MSRLFLALLLIPLALPLPAARNAPLIPDFTNGGTTDGSHDWNLGSTGASGWIFAQKHTDAARQILITRVTEGTPADGLLKPDDVILGIADKPFESDARLAFARALARAEAGGIMFSHTIQMDGLELFTAHQISEAIELIVNFAHDQKKHGSEKRLVTLMNMLKSYRAHAQRVIPELEAMAEDFEDGEPNYPRDLSRQKAQLVRDTIREIQSATQKPELLELNL